MRRNNKQQWLNAVFFREKLRNYALASIQRAVNAVKYKLVYND